MPIQFRCSHCNKRVQAPDAAAGKKAKCPVCGELIEVPAEEPDDDPLAGLDKSIARLSSEAAPPKAPQAYLGGGSTGDELPHINVQTSSLAGARARHPTAKESSGAFDFRNASPQDLKKEYKRIAKETGDYRFLTRKELNYLPEVLGEGEQVLAFSSGLMSGDSWLIALTDKRIIFLDKGFVLGLKQVAIDLDKVNAVSGETGLVWGKISIQDGASAKTISNVWKSTVRPFTNKVRDAIEARKKTFREAIQTTSSDDLVSRLEKLATLVDRGIITQEEFARQKLRLLET
jgi:phage FluMu protein Com/ribosomal protein S20